MSSGAVLFSNIEDEDEEENDGDEYVETVQPAEIASTVRVAPVDWEVQAARQQRLRGARLSEFFRAQKKTDEESNAGERVQ